MTIQMTSGLEDSAILQMAKTTKSDAVVKMMVTNDQNENSR